MRVEKRVLEGDDVGSCEVLHLSTSRCDPIEKDAEFLLVMLAANLAHVTLADKGLDGQFNRFAPAVFDRAGVPPDDVFHILSTMRFLPFCR